MGSFRLHWDLEALRRTLQSSLFLIKRQPATSRAFFFLSCFVLFCRASTADCSKSKRVRVIRKYPNRLPFSHQITLFETSFHRSSVWSLAMRHDAKLRY